MPIIKFTPSKENNMNKLIYLLGVLILPFMIGCQKNEPVSPSFEVTTDKQEYKAGDSVTFAISGYADIISFYSGEAGKEYRYKDRTESTDSKLKLNVTTQVVFASQKKNLSLLYSTNFNNVYTAEGLKSATWTDITDRFTLSADVGSINGVQTASGDVDLSDLPVSGKPIYFAWKYVGQESTSAALGGRTWRVYVFNLFNQNAANQTSSIASVTTAGWLGIDVLNPANKWTIQTTAPALYFAPNGTLSASEDWAVSRALFPTAAMPDLATGIKGYTDKINNYKYSYRTPGVYKVTFVARNASNLGLKEVVKELTVTVK